MAEFFLRMKNLLDAAPVTVRLALIVLAGCAALVLAFFAGKTAGALNAERKYLRRIKHDRADAVRRSRAALGGQLAEQVAPFLPGFPCNPADARFVGKPVDFVAFPGAADGGSVDEVLFIEVKSGSSALSAREREVKNAVERGSVRYIEYRVPAE